MTDRDRYGAREARFTDKWLLWSIKTRERPANRFLFPRPHKHQRTLLARILGEWNIWLHYRRSTVAATTALCCVGTVVEKKAARDALHDLCSEGNNSLQRRCLCRSTFCLFLIASRTRDTRDSIHHTWNVTTRNLVTTNDETSKRRHESRPGMCSNHSASRFIFGSSLSLLFTRYTFAPIVQYSLSISFLSYFCRSCSLPLYLFLSFSLRREIGANHCRRSIFTGLPPFAFFLLR